MKQYTIPQIIEIFKKLSISNFEQADEIAWYFHDQRITYVPSGNLHMGFYRMIMAIWTAGYISGVQAEREKQRNRKKTDRRKDGYGTQNQSPAHNEIGDHLATQAIKRSPKPRNDL